MTGPGRILAEETRSLTKTDLAAIRHADEIDAHRYDDGTSWLHCIKRRTYDGREANPFLEDTTIRIEVDGSVRCYESVDEPIVAFGRIAHHVSLDRLLKIGDRLFLRWVRGNNHDYLRAAKMSADELHLEIVRATDVNGRRPIRLLADYSVVPSHSLARMVRTRR